MRSTLARDGVQRQSPWPSFLPSPRNTPMHVVLVTNDLVRLSFLTCLLRDAGVEAVVLDNQVSTLEGSIGAIPRRLVVASEDSVQAMRVLREAGEA